MLRYLWWPAVAGTLTMPTVGQEGEGHPEEMDTRPPTDSAREMPTGLEPQKQQCGGHVPRHQFYFLGKLAAMLGEGEEGRIIYKYGMSPLLL